MPTLLTTSYQLVGSVKTSTYSTLRLYAKYNSQSVSGNTSSVSLQARLYGNGGSGSFSGGTVTINGSSTTLSTTSYSSGSENTLTTKTFTLSHDSDGTLTKTISYSITSNGAVSGSSSASITLPTIPRTSVPTLSSSSVNLGSSVTIYTNRQSSSFTHSIYYSIGSISNTLLASSVTTSYVWTVPKTLANQITSSLNGTVTLKVVTYNGSTQIGSKEITLKVVVPDTDEFYPTIDSVSLEEASSIDTTVFENYIQNVSKIKGSVTASGVYGSTISSYSIKLNNETFTSSSFTTSTITLVNPTITVTVKDSRGRSKVYEETITVLEYDIPTISNFQTYRNETDNSKLDVVFDCDVYSLDGKNEIQFLYYYQDSESSSYSKVAIDTSDLTMTEENGVITYSANLSVLSSDTSLSYNAYLMVTDTFNSVSTGTSLINTIFKLINISADKRAFAIGKMHEEDGYIENALPQINYDNIYRRDSEYDGKVLSSPDIDDGKIAFNDNNFLEFSNGDVTYEIPIRESGEENYLESKELYNSTTGSNASISLSSACDDAYFIDVFVRNGDSYYNFVRVYEPLSKYFTVMTLDPNDSSKVYYQNAKYLVSSKTLSLKTYSEITFSDGSTPSVSTSTNRIYITKVVGYFKK